MITPINDDRRMMGINLCSSENGGKVNECPFPGLKKMKTADIFYGNFIAELISAGLVTAARAGSLELPTQHQQHPFLKNFNTRIDFLLNTP